MQPNFVGLWGAAGGMYEVAIGGERWRWMNRFRSLSRRGVPLAFGSDCMPMEPIMGLRGAIQHPIEEERLTPDEALVAYTAGSAYAGFAENETGTIEPGKLADIALFAGDPRSASSVADCPVVATIVGGKTVFAAEAEPRSDSAPDRAARGRE
jgi:predicted amidohydrolase YtcJ